MAKNVFNYLNRIDDLKDSVAEDADTILESIDIDLLLKNPDEYLEAKAAMFLKEHLPEIKKGQKEGESFADKVI